MKSRGADRLLGGYATGTLTAEERAALFSAALDDQELFDALADEEALRHLLADPAARARVAAALGEPRTGWAAALAAWWRSPAWRVVAAGAAVGLMAIVVMRVGRIPEEKTQIAELRPAPSSALLAPRREAETAVTARSAEEPAMRARPKAANEAPLVRRAPELDAKEEKAPARAEVVPPPPLKPQEPNAPQEVIVADQAAAPAAPQVVGEAAASGLVAARRDNAAKENIAKMRAMGVRQVGAEGMARAGFLASQASAIPWRVVRTASPDQPVAASGTVTVRTGEPFHIEVMPATRGWVHIQEMEGANRWKRVAGGEAGPDKPLRFPASGTLEFGEPVRKVWMAVFSTAPGDAPVAGATNIVVEVVR
jgi:hypothetical protein